MNVVLHFQSTGSIPGNGDPIQMQGVSLTIGRGAENDLVLPDPDRTLSKRHCAIENHNGNVIVVDFSTNGTFLNYGKLPLGTTPTPLNTGDILSVGPYEIMVDINTGEEAANMIAEPMAEGPVSHGVADMAPNAVDLLDAPGDGGDFLDDLLSGRDAPVGPGGVNRDEPDDDDGLLPPLGEEDGILPPAPDPMEEQGASFGMHSPSGQDAFVAPGRADQAIPDDWDDDLLGPQGGSSAGRAGNASDPFASGGGAAAGGSPSFIPDDFGPDGRTIMPGSQPLPPAQPEHRATTQSPTQTPARGGGTDPGSITVPPPRNALLDNSEMPTDPGRSQPAAPAAQPAPAAAGDAASRAFLEALGADDLDIADADLRETMIRMGQMMRIMVEGLREILMTRTSIKSEFRIERTEIQLGGNNPLKFSISPEQAIEAMVKPKARGYLDAIDATSEALDDIKAHEVAMVTGMEAALKGVLARLGPDALEEKLTAGGGLTGMLKSRKARYWEVYEQMYAQISDEAENEFHSLFAREFAKAYKNQLDQLK